jgi:hypothetical protein
MATVLVATSSGCRVLSETGERETELAGRQFSAMASEVEGTCLAIIDRHEIWRRSLDGAWTKVAAANIRLQSITSIDGVIFGGGMDEAAVVCIRANGEAKRLPGFDICSGRNEWFAGGPPLGVRSLAATRDGAAIIAAVHVGGLPYSLDKGNTWKPTVPIMFDVHEVRTHPSLPNIVAAAAAVGLCVSHDSGHTWEVISEGLELSNSLAVAILRDEVLFGIADGPFAKQSQIWRWRIGSKRVEQVRDGLPEWLDGKVDTAQIAATSERAAVVDGGGKLWLSEAGSRDWKCIATDIPYPFGLSIVSD